LVYGGDVVVLDAGQLAVEVIAGMRAWFQDLQMDSARVSNVAAHLKKLVIVTDQELPGIGGGSFSGTHTSTGLSSRRPLSQRLGSTGTILGQKRRAGIAPALFASATY
jgi:hypothetical protein